MKNIGFMELEPFLDRKRHELLAALSEFSTEELHRAKETQDGWSPTQITEHLAIVEQLVIEQTETLLRSEVPAPPEPFEAKVVDITELFRERGLLGTRKKTPPSQEPSGSVPYELALQRLTDARVRLKSLLPELAGRSTNGLTAPHPLGVTLNACQWVLFSAFHEWGHIHQVKRIRAAYPKET